MTIAVIRNSRVSRRGYNIQNVVVAFAFGALVCFAAMQPYVRNHSGCDIVGGAAEDDFKSSVRGLKRIQSGATHLQLSTTPSDFTIDDDDQEDGFSPDDFPSDRSVSMTNIKAPTKFLYAYYTADADSYQVKDSNTSALEPGITALLSNRIRQCCADGGHFIDVGAHFGYYSLLAASMGCTYSSFEPVPAFVKIIQLNQYLNKVAHKGEVINVGIDNVEGTAANAMMYLPDVGVLGTAHVKRYENGSYLALRPIDYTFDSTQPIVLEKLDAHIQASPGRRICSLKIDVEGDEPYVIRSAQQLLSSGAVETIVTEFSPIFNDNIHHLEGMLATLSDLDYYAYNLPWAFVKREQPVAAIDVSEVFREILSLGTKEQRLDYIKRVTPGGNTNIWFEKKDLRMQFKDNLSTVNIGKHQYNPNHSED